MILPDVNVLVYAYNASNRHNSVARAWWEATLNGQRPVALAHVVILGFVRIITNPRAVPSPITVRQAADTVRHWLSAPALSVVQPGPSHVELMLQLIESAGVAGNLTTDAHLAALAIEWQAEVATCDLDFARFAGVRWFNPLKQKRG